MRPVDADALIEKIENENCKSCKEIYEIILKENMEGYCLKCGIYGCLETIRNAETVSTVKVTQNGNNCVSIQNCNYNKGGSR